MTSSDLRGHLGLYVASFLQMQCVAGQTYGGDKISTDILVIGLPSVAWSLCDIAGYLVFHT